MSRDEFRLYAMELADKASNRMGSHDVVFFTGRYSRGIIRVGEGPHDAQHAHIVISSADGTKCVGIHVWLSADSKRRFNRSSSRLPPHSGLPWIPWKTRSGSGRLSRNRRPQRTEIDPLRLRAVIRNRLTQAQVPFAHLIKISATSGRENSCGGRWPALSMSRTFVPLRMTLSSGPCGQVLLLTRPLRRCCTRRCART